MTVRNCRIKWLPEQNPVAKAMSVIDIELPANMPQACSMR